jgi:hypothetical protein
MTGKKYAMKKLFIIILIALTALHCTESLRDSTGDTYTYGNTTENTKISSDKIDGSPTYEIFFTLEKPVDCFTINIETVFLQKSFPVQKIPQKTYFIIEKKLILPHRKSSKEINFTPLGRNFNNDWELFTPVKVCTNKNDPLSVIDASEYRIRFTAFDKQKLYFIITIQCGSKILFSDYNPVK